MIETENIILTGEEKKEELQRLMEENSALLAIMKGGEKTSFWKEVLKVLYRSIKANERDIKQLEGKVGDMDALEFQRELIKLQSHKNALNMLKWLPKKVIASAQNSISMLEDGGVDVNFITPLKEDEK